MQIARCDCGVEWDDENMIEAVNSMIDHWKKGHVAKPVDRMAGRRIAQVARKLAILQNISVGYSS